VAYVGIISLYLACAGTILSIILGFRALKDKKEPLGILTHWASALSTLCITLSALSLVLALLTNDFNIAYVARHSARNLPLIYKISAFWAGQSGSLLLWLLIISFLSLVVQKNRKYQQNHLHIRLCIVINFVRLLFILLLLFVTPIFELLAERPFDGSGLNPMLQSLGMVIHPPVLFLGFSGFLIPFAFAVIGLWTNDTQATWLRHVGKWVLFAWLFLTMGIVTGGQWAYTELGWGGYWAWDPVENSSFFPWLTSTALLHILLLPNKHRLKRVWSYVLIVLTYTLTIFATFLTRSGVLDSVHAFAGGVLGQIFLAVLVVMAVFCFGLGWHKRQMLSMVPTESTLSNQGLSATGKTIVVGSVLLLMLFAGVLFGTMFPVITRVFTAREVVLDASFFNQLSVPLFLGTIFLMGMSPLLHKKASDIKILTKRLALPVLLALVAAVFTYLSTGHLAASVAFALAAFGFGTHLPVLLSPDSSRRWGGSLVHLGLLIIMVGITGSSIFVDDVLVSVEPGQEIVFGDYRLEYEGLTVRYGSERYTVGTTLAIVENGRCRGEITSEKTFWEGRDQPSTRVGILSTLKEDIYLNLAGWENTTAQLHLQRFALVSWIWAGSWVMYFGVLVALLGDMKLNVKGKQVKLWPRQMR
jgi:cytochrome c-type biogenesis protein CcmF